MNWLYIIYIVICSFPAFYFASKRNFVVIPNQKFNSFLFRLIFILPTFLILIFVLSLILSSFLQIIISNDSLMVNIIASFTIGLMIIILLEKYAIKQDLPPQLRPDFMEYDLYIFTPKNIDIRNTLLRDIESKRKNKNKSQNLNHIEHNGIIFTREGELIIAQNTLSLFEEKELTGFQAIPIENTDYYKVLAIHTMPPFSDKTTINIGYSPERLVFDGNIFYNNANTKQAFDLNRSYESVGRDSNLLYFSYIKQNYWILSNKTVNFFINELKMSKRDFIPINLIIDK